MAAALRQDSPKNEELELRFGRKLSYFGDDANGNQKLYNKFDTNIGHRLFTQYLTLLSKTGKFHPMTLTISQTTNYESKGKGSRNNFREEIFSVKDYRTNLESVLKDLSGGTILREKITHGIDREVVEKRTIETDFHFMDIHDVKMSRSVEIPVKDGTDLGKPSVVRLKYRISLTHQEFPFRIDMTHVVTLQSERTDIGMTQYQLELEYTDGKDVNIRKDITQMMRYLYPDVPVFPFIEKAMLAPKLTYADPISFPESIKQEIIKETIPKGVTTKSLILTKENIWYPKVKAEELLKIPDMIKEILRYYYHDNINTLSIYGGGLGIISSILSKHFKLQVYDQGQSTCAAFVHNHRAMKGKDCLVYCDEVVRYFPNNDVLFFNLPGNKTGNFINGIPISTFILMSAPHCRAVFIKSMAGSKIHLNDLGEKLQKHFIVEHVIKSEFILTLLLPRTVMYTKDLYIAEAHNILSNSMEKRQRNYMDKINRDFKRGGEFIQKFAKPVDLKRGKRGELLLVDNTWAVTDKLDGIGCRLLMIGGCGYVINSRGIKHVYKTDPRLNKTMIDGEFLSMEESKDEESIPQFHAYDILRIKGVDVTGKTLLERLKILKDNVKIHGGFFFVKTFLHSGDISSDVAKIHNMMEERKRENPDIGTDGMIFTPLHDGYLSNNILKWKPIDQLTIDFRIVKIPPVAKAAPVKKKRRPRKHNAITVGNTKIDTDGVDIVPVKENQYYITYQVPGDKYGERSNILKVFEERGGSLAIVTIDELPVKDHDVVEFKFDGNQFHAERIRHDKKISGPNFVKVVKDIFHHHDSDYPKTEKELIERLRGKSTDRVVFNYNGSIKRKLIEQYTRKADVLDIGGGYGGDILKYRHANVKHIYFVEPNKQNIEKFIMRHGVPIYMDESVRKIAGIRNNIGSKEDHTLINAGGEQTRYIMQHLKGKKVDVVSMFFSLTFFFQNEKMLDKLINTIELSLKDGGYFIGTTMDGDKTGELLSKLDNGEVKDIGPGLVNITKLYNNVEKFGSKVKVDIINSPIVSDQIEWLVSFDELIKQLALRGINLVESEYFKPCDDSPMTEGQRLFTQLNRSFVFKKEGGVVAKERVFTIKKQFSIPRRKFELGKELSLDYSTKFIYERTFKEDDKDFLVRIGAVTRGSSFFHAVLHAIGTSTYLNAYDDDDKSLKTHKQKMINSRIKIVDSLRKRLANDLSYEKFIELEPSVLTTQVFIDLISKDLSERFNVRSNIVSGFSEYLTISGAMKRVHEVVLETYDFIKSAPVVAAAEAQPSRKTIDENAKAMIDSFSKIAYKQYLNNLTDPNGYIDREMTSELSRLLGVGIFIVRDSEVYPYVKNPVAKDRNIFVLWQGRRNHYEVLGVQSKETGIITTLFSKDHPIVTNFFKHKREDDEIFEIQRRGGDITKSALWKRYEEEHIAKTVEEENKKKLEGKLMYEKFMKSLAEDDEPAEERKDGNDGNDDEWLFDLPDPDEGDEGDEGDKSEGGYGDPDDQGTPDEEPYE